MCKTATVNSAPKYGPSQIIHKYWRDWNSTGWKLNENTFKNKRNKVDGWEREIIPFFSTSSGQRYQGKCYAPLFKQTWKSWNQCLMRSLTICQGQVCWGVALRQPSSINLIQVYAAQSSVRRQLIHSAEPWTNLMLISDQLVWQSLVGLKTWRLPSNIPAFSHEWKPGPGREGEVNQGHQKEDGV